MELEKRYWVLKAYSTSGRFDLDTFRPIVSPPIPETVCQGQLSPEACYSHVSYQFFNNLVICFSVGTILTHWKLNR